MFSSSFKAWIFVLNVFTVKSRVVRRDSELGEGLDIREGLEGFRVQVSSSL